MKNKINSNQMLFINIICLWTWLPLPLVTSFNYFANYLDAQTLEYAEVHTTLDVRWTRPPNIQCIYIYSRQRGATAYNSIKTVALFVWSGCPLSRVLINIADKDCRGIFAIASRASIERCPG